MVDDGTGMAQTAPSRGRRKHTPTFRKVDQERTISHQVSSQEGIDRLSRHVHDRCRRASKARINRSFSRGVLMAIRIDC